MRALSALGLTIACAVSVSVARADRVAPADGEGGESGAPPPDGEPRLYTTEPVAPPEIGQRSHKGQLGLAVSLLTGGRFIKTYDQEYCGARDDNGSTSGNSRCASAASRSRSTCRSATA
jgi:hypothetical protein